MRGLRLFFGVLLAVVALFAGGCGLYFFSLGLMAEVRGGGDDYSMMWISSLFGILPGLVAGVFAVILLSGGPRDHDPQG